MITNAYNTDPNEIAKFSAFAKNWWDANGPMKPLHQLNPLRLSYIMQHVNLHDKKILDIGCGGGILTESLARSGAIVTGIDMSEQAIVIAKQHAEQSSLIIHYQQIDTETFSNQHEKSFDIIACMEMLEHVPDPNSIIQSTAKLIKPGGFIFFSTINRHIKSFLSAILGAEYILHLLPKGTHEYQKFIRPSELKQCAVNVGLTLQHIQGITYHPLSSIFEFTDSVDVNYLMCFQAK